MFSQMPIKLFTTSALSIKVEAALKPCHVIFSNESNQKKSRVIQNVVLIIYSIFSEPRTSKNTIRKATFVKGYMLLSKKVGNH